MTARWRRDSGISNAPKSDRPACPVCLQRNHLGAVGIGIQHQDQMSVTKLKANIRISSRDNVEVLVENIDSGSSSGRGPVRDPHSGFFVASSVAFDQAH